MTGVGMPSAHSSPMATSKASPVRTRVAHSPSSPGDAIDDHREVGMPAPRPGGELGRVVDDRSLMLDPRRIVGTTTAIESAPPPPPLPCEGDQRADGAQGAEHEDEHLLHGDGEHDPTDE